MTDLWVKFWDYLAIPARYVERKTADEKLAYAFFGMIALCAILVILVAPH